MKKLLSVTLVCLMIMQIIPVSLASNVASDQDNIKGEILNFTMDTVKKQSASNTIVSYEENSDGSVTVYQYKNGDLIEAHTTIPGSGVIHHEYYNGDDVTFSMEQVDVDYEVANFSSNVTRADTPDYVNNRPLGYMHYNNGIIPIISIYCHVEEEGYDDRGFTLREGTAKTLSEWTSWLLARIAVMGSTVGVLAKMVSRWVVKGVLEEQLDDLFMVLVTKTITCSYYNQHIYGECTTHSGKDEGLLEGTYIYYDGDIITEGYTTRMWGQDALGRMMFYKVVGVEYIPTSWTNVNVYSQ